MGTYIHTCIETLTEAGWAVNENPIFTADPTWPGMEGATFTHRAFFSQNYELFTLLVRARDVPGITPLGDFRGLPEDASDEAVHELIGHYETTLWDDPDVELTVNERVSRRVNVDRGGYSWIGVDELLAIDYDTTVDQGTDQNSAVTLRDALGGLYMRHLEEIQILGAPTKTRVLFCFDW